LKFNEYFFQLHSSNVHPHKKGAHNKHQAPAHLLSKRDIEEGFTEFFKSLPDIEADYPHLPNLLSDLIYFTFIEKNIADFSKVEIKLPEEELLEDEEPMYFVDIYFKVFGSFLAKIEERLGDEKLDYYYSHFHIKSKLDAIKQYVDEEAYSEINASEKVLSLIK
jgi:hypothetical protein